MMVKARFIGTPPLGRHVKDLGPEESGYAVPWAFDPQSSELDENASLHDAPCGTVELLVTRRLDGYEVGLIAGSDYVWR